MEYLCIDEAHTSVRAFAHAATRRRVHEHKLPVERGLLVRLYSRDVLRFSERSDLEPQKGRLPGSVIRQTTINDISCRICMPRPRQREPTVPNLTCFTEGVRLNVPRVLQMSQKLRREGKGERERKRKRGSREVLS